jgi:hypothetical protein
MEFYGITALLSGNRHETDQAETNDSQRDDASQHGNPRFC